MNNTGSEPWPIGAPRPESNSTYASDIHVANELFLCAVAWIIHHEITHILLNHSNLSSAYSIQQEKEADLRATDWILRLSSVRAEKQKRILGIATALLAMQILDKPGNPSGYVRDHPPSYERLDCFLNQAGVSDDDVSCAFAVVVLHFQLVQFGIATKLDGSSFRDTLSDMILAFARHGRK